MNRLFRIILACAVALCALACTDPLVSTFGSVGGTVQDRGTNKLLSGVTVTLNPLGYKQVTNMNGDFQFDNLDVSEYILVFEKEGYEKYVHKVSVKPGVVSSVQVTLAAAVRGLPDVNIESVGFISDIAARADGVIYSLGDDKVSDYGFCWSETGMPEVTDSYVSLGSSDVAKSFAANITGLKPATQYFVRAYARNSYGVSYGSYHVQFTTLGASSGQGNGGSGSNIVVPNGLVGYYTFDDGNAADKTEYQNDASLIGNPSFVTATPNEKGKALFINGMKDQYVTIPYNLLQGQSQYSVAFWIKDFTNGIIFSAVSANSLKMYPCLVADTDSKFLWGTESLDYDVYPFTYDYTNIQNSGWHHVAVTANNGSRALYIDGKKVDANGDQNDPRVPSEVTGFSIGGRWDIHWKNEWEPITMKIDNVRFHMKELTESEVSQIYNGERQ